MKRPKSVLSAAAFGAALLISGLTAQSAAAADNSLIVRDFTMTSSVVGREPVDKVATYGVRDQQAYAFARINNAGAPTQVQFRWYYNGQHHATVPLNVGTSPGWRTWSTAQLRPGNWRVQLLDADGIVLMSRSFSVNGSGSRMNVAKRDRSTNPFTHTTNPMDDVEPSSGRSSRTQQRYPSYNGYTGPYPN